jgi:cytochrome c-type biogenesis protein CcmH/NrfG
MLIGVSLLAFVFVAVSLWLWQKGRLELKSWLGALVLVAWVVGVGVKVHLDRQGDSRVAPAVAALPSIAWPSSGRAEPATGTGAGAPQADGSSPTQVAPVSSLVGGLEQRLAAQPDDVNGWALLAQSYAFMGDAAAADGAVKKAVALGMDEQTLRARVDNAMRGPHPN